MSGSNYIGFLSVPDEELYIYSSGNSFPVLKTSHVYSSTGTAMRPDGRQKTSVDDMWKMMYLEPKPVIIVCGFCKSHNAISNPTCIQCGAPMGLGVQREYA